MIAPRRYRGITLLESVLALSLSVGLMGTVLGLYRHMLDTRTDIVQDVQLTTSERIVMDRITGELRASMVYPFLGFGMEGQPQEMKFISVALPGPAAWAVRQTTDDPIPPEVDLQMVGYRLRVVEDEEGLLHVEGLERTSQKILAAREAEEGEEIEVHLLAPQIKFLWLRYWQGEEWVDTWTDNGLPLAVEINLGTDVLPEDMEPADYVLEYDTFRRVVYVPGAEGSVTGPVIRGLNRGSGR